VDTYDALQGVEKAIAVGKQLRERGHDLLGIRLDSGDLAYLSQRARALLDAAGFEKAAIVASNDLDEHTIQSLREQGAPIGLWGVGTRLVTGHDQPALGGVYKLAAVHDGASWQPRIKLSEQLIKTSTPGRQQVRRFFDGTHYAGDAIYNLDAPPKGPWAIVDPNDPSRRKRFDPALSHEDLLVPIFVGGKRTYETPGLADARARAAREVARLHPASRRFLNPHQYPAGLESSLHELKWRMMQAARGDNA
jgi:nicotinate phosphoribosyltransferase